MSTIRVAIEHLQRERDILSDEKQALATELLQFPHSNRPIGEGPESGDYVTWIHTVPGNEATADAYDRLYAKHQTAVARYEANVAVTRQLEAWLRT